MRCMRLRGVNADASKFGYDKTGTPELAKMPKLLLDET